MECDRRGINLPVECDRRASSKGTSHARSRHRRRGSDPDRACLQGLAGLTAAGRDPRVRRRSGPRAQPRGRSGRCRGGHRRLRSAAGAAGQQHRPHRGAAERQARRADERLDHLALLLLRPRRDPHSGQPRRRRSGRRLHRRRRRVRLELQRHPGGRPSRGPARGPAGKQRPARRLHRDGPDGRERRGALRRHPRAAGRVRPALPGARGRRAAKRASSIARSSRSRCQRHRGHQGRRPAAVVDAREARDARARVQAGRHA